MTYQLGALYQLTAIHYADGVPNCWSSCQTQYPWSRHTMTHISKFESCGTRRQPSRRVDILRRAGRIDHEDDWKHEHALADRIAALLPPREDTPE